MRKLKRLSRGAAARLVDGINQQVERGAAGAYLPSLRSHRTMVADALDRNGLDDELADLHLAAWSAIEFNGLAMRLGCIDQQQPRPESPIEWLMMYALILAGQRVCPDVRIRDWPIGAASVLMPRLVIEPQKQIGNYRADFLVTLVWDGARLVPGVVGEPSSQVVVECDGHDFHERTKEQASRDKARDRAMQASGLTVFRFTGSDVWADAFKAAEECLVFLRARVADAASVLPRVVEE